MNDEVSSGRRDLGERTFEFARRVVRLCQVLERTPGVGRTLATQLLRSGTSIGTNVEEGQAAQSRADFLSKLS
ncbi:MAG: four helix bundle protein, partial [Rubrobacter sp.]